MDKYINMMFIKIAETHDITITMNMFWSTEMERVSKKYTLRIDGDQKIFWGKRKLVLEMSTWI